MRDVDIPGIVHFFTENKLGRDFVVGDIHGEFYSLHKILMKVKFNPDCDRLFSVGDVVDRGTQSELVVSWLKKTWFHSVRGNHEQMLIDCIDGYGDVERHRRNGGAWFYKLPATEQLNIVSALRELPFAIELVVKGNKVGVIHAQAPLLKSEDDWQECIAALSGKRGEDAFQQAKNLALYSRAKFSSQDNTLIKGISALYVGHTTVLNVLKLGNTNYIDTGCSFSDGVLTVINLSAGVVITSGC